MGNDDQVPRLQHVIQDLPEDFDALRAEARAEGYRLVERLATDWLSGTMRFDRKGEVLLAARRKTVLCGIGGLTIEPVVSDALRMRRFYIRPPYRRSGIGRMLAIALLERAQSRTGLVTVNAAPASAAFWESLGFTPDIRDGHTHVHIMTTGFCRPQLSEPSEV